MKQKVHYLLMLCVMSIVSLNGWAQEESPTPREELQSLVNSAKGEGYPVFAYEDILQNEASADAELTNAYAELTNAIELTKKGAGAYSGEYKALFVGKNGGFATYTDGGVYSVPCPYIYSHKSLTCYVEVDQYCNFYYAPDENFVSDVWIDIDVFVDGKRYDNCTRSAIRGYEHLKYIDLNAGKHKIEWVRNDKEQNVQVGMMGLYSLPKITVNLLEPGSLGTEVLYNVDKIQQVRNLKVYGTLNSNDISTIRMMTNLFVLDLSEATYKGSLPNEWWKGDDYNGYANKIHRISLPQGLTSIGQGCFSGSNLDSITFPSSLKTIASRAFYRTHLKNVVFSDNITSIPDGLFDECYDLQKIKNWPKTISEIPSSTFYGCGNLEAVELPNNLTSIGQNAFYRCSKLKMRMPKSLLNVGNEAFYGCSSLDSLVFVNDNIKLGFRAFGNCAGIKYIEFPMVTNDVFDSDGDQFLTCTSIQDIVLKSGSIVPAARDLLYGVNMGQITLHVPNFLVNYYKLNSFWYKCGKIEGFATKGIQNWNIYNSLTMNANERFNEEISLTLHEGVTFKVNGEASMPLKDFCIYTNSVDSKTSQVLSKCNNITISGTTSLNYYTKSKTWYFISLPFDCKIADITFGADAVQYAIRYYDGANRATVGATGSWKNYDKTADVIPAGTGFIIQTNKDTWCYFKAVDNDMKQNMVSYKEFSKTLEVNDCETASNKGWNLIGNPYQCFYNDHSLNFTAPITVWNNYNKNYVAYSLTDDDYAIRPNEAFFVQCPNAEYNTVTFPLQGRQLNDVIESQNAAKAATSVASTRKLVNLTLSNSEQTDKTRIVLNEKASLSYETSCDASKFMSMDNSVPQLYTVGADGTQYAINERPEADGKVALAYVAAKEGTYTIAVTRCDAQQVYLIDNETSETTDITNSEYTFSTEAGANASRFVIAFNAGETTGIHNVDANVNANANNGSYYNLAGQRVQNAGKGIFITNGKKVIK